MGGTRNESDAVDLLEDIVRREGRALLAYARTVTGHAQDAEDALQEAFFHFAGQSGAEIANPRAYLYTAVRNAARNMFRTRTRRARREEMSEPGENAIFQEPAGRAEELAALNEAMATIPDDQREVLVMKVWGGMSFSEIADVAGIPRDTAASRYRYGIEALRKRMRKFTDV